MVQLCMTPRVVYALHEAERLAPSELAELQKEDEAPLTDAAVGNPISHAQLIAISKLLRNHNDEFTLEFLLKGCTFYTPPPPPKKEPTPEYTALMTRLRAAEEARAYERMINPHRTSETMSASPLAHMHPREADFEVDDVSYADVHRQMILIINVLVSIIACSVFIWVAARHWSAPKRLGLSMAGSLVVAVAEVVIYNGYVRRIKEAKLVEKKKPEVKTIVESWVIDGKGKGKGIVTATAKEKAKTDDGNGDGVRLRKGVKNR